MLSPQTKKPDRKKHDSSPDADESLRQWHKQWMLEDKEVAREEKEEEKEEEQEESEEEKRYREEEEERVKTFWREAFEAEEAEERRVELYMLEQIDRGVEELMKATVVEGHDAWSHLRESSSWKSRKERRQRRERKAEASKPEKEP